MVAPSPLGDRQIVELKMLAVGTKMGLMHWVYESRRLLGGRVL